MTPLKRPAIEETSDTYFPAAKSRRTEAQTEYSAAKANGDANASDNDDNANTSEPESEPEPEEPCAPEIEGLYLDTVNRANLDFDFEQLCSISLSNNNVYACLVCGKYYQGRGKQTHAYFHSINESHHVFINLRTLGIYVLPDNYKVDDESLNDIKAAVRPMYSTESVALLDRTCVSAHDLSGKRYIPGL
ncbi:U4 U6.U5 tri-snRNP-associated protein, partial [Coemansia aciculifera]